jgi:hypothetical protein
MRHGRLVITLLILITGCAAPTFKLSDESAIDRLMATRHVLELQQASPIRLIAWVERREADARPVYLGEDHADHAVRMGAYRVTSDGRVWVNADLMLLDERWVLVE